MNIDQTVDLCGLQCPTPLVRLNDVIAELAVGETLEAVADDTAFELDVAAWCEYTGHELVDLCTNDQAIRAVIRKSDS